MRVISSIDSKAPQSTSGTQSVPPKKKKKRSTFAFTKAPLQQNSSNKDITSLTSSTAQSNGEQRERKKYHEDTLTKAFLQRNLSNPDIREYIHAHLKHMHTHHVSTLLHGLAQRKKILPADIAAPLVDHLYTRQDVFRDKVNKVVISKLFQGLRCIGDKPPESRDKLLKHLTENLKVINVIVQISMTFNL
jgi:hypothetical protein